MVRKGWIDCIRCRCITRRVLISATIPWIVSIVMEIIFTIGSNIDLVDYLIQWPRFIATIIQICSRPIWISIFVRVGTSRRCFVRWSVMIGRVHHTSCGTISLEIESEPISKWWWWNNRMWQRNETKWNKVNDGDDAPLNEPDVVVVVVVVVGRLDS